jgi:hypothetical protein
LVTNDDDAIETTVVISAETEDGNFKGICTIQIVYFLGDGDKISPYLIGTPKQLAKLSEVAKNVYSPYADLGKYFKLTDDIDLTGYGAGFNNGKGWIPIGGEYYVFGGNFDGNHKKVKGLFIDDNSLDYCGLFGYVHACSISNLNLIDVDITGDIFVGGISGFISEINGVSKSAITNCLVTGSIKGKLRVGGVIGLSGGKNIIDECCSICNVIGSDHVGGIVGETNNSSKISNCFSSSTVTSSVTTGYSGSFAGGIVGLCYDSQVINTFSIGDVTGNEYIGGVVGFAKDANFINETIISNCYATGSIKGEGNVGGVAGYLLGTLSHCAALNQSVISGGSFLGRVVGVQMGGTLSSNVAINIMEIDDYGHTIGNMDGNSKDGADITIEQVKMEETYTTATLGDTLFTLDWDFTGASPIWKMGLNGYRLPVLSWQTSAPDMPAHL